MLRLIIIRHAKSLHDSYVDLDMERHLAARGYKEAQEAALWCKSKAIEPDLLVSSPAIRAFTTALIFANRYGYPSDRIELNASIYEAGLKALMYVINELPSDRKTIMIFGHNPGFEDLARFLCGPVLQHFPPAGVAIVDFKAGKWETIGEGDGTLHDFYNPRD